MTRHGATGELHGFANNTGHLLRIRPELGVVARMPHLRGAHNVQLVGDDVFVNHTLARTFEVHACDGGGRPRARVALDAVSAPSEQFATSGWIRGMCWVNRETLVVGTSPAALIAIDLTTMRVTDRLQLEQEITHAVHGLASGPE